MSDTKTKETTQTVQPPTVQPPVVPAPTVPAPTVQAPVQTVQVPAPPAATPAENQAPAPKFEQPTAEQTAKGIVDVAESMTSQVPPHLRELMPTDPAAKIVWIKKGLDAKAFGPEHVPTTDTGRPGSTPAAPDYSGMDSTSKIAAGFAGGAK